MLLAVSFIGLLPDAPASRSRFSPCPSKEGAGTPAVARVNPRFTGPKRGQHGFPNLVSSHQVS